jgi:hypothetical protein
MQDTTNCKICNHSSTLLFSKKILNKYDGYYFQCEHCKFIQLENVSWLDEAYSNAITDLDIGLVSRNENLKTKTSLLIKWFFKEAKISLDYAGGYGLFVRMMRDLGFNFYRQDIYCKNMFSVHFDIEDTEIKKFDFLTAFEVFEHFEKPIEEFSKINEISDHILFSTELQPKNPAKIKDWWYLTPETGQHLAFYTEESLKILAEKNSKHYYCIDKTLHLITTKKINTKKLKFLLKEHFTQKILKWLFLPKNDTLLQSDYNFILKGLKK